MILNREVNGMEVSGACLEGIMLNEKVRERQILYHLNVESKKDEFRETE